ncbi:YczE/YyaS/YitT family protein [Plantibacter sp. YIM 135249]|uniref:membrane protein YczE n=1 Tax=Plantibacter sp. YIM 135249 TaxID=3423918 RepID=UPI003D32639C
MTRRIIQLFSGLLLYGIAIAMIVRAGIGVAPWDVFGQGVAMKTGISFGLSAVIIGAVVLLAWIPLRQKPGIGTLCNVLLVGPAADLGLWLIPADLVLWARLLLFAGGLLLLGVASGLYIGARFGAGPRDGLMTGIHHRTGWPIWVGRTIVEVVVLGIGWLLGGNVGVGTVLFAVLIGPICGWTIPFFRTPEPVSSAAPALPTLSTTTTTTDPDPDPDPVAEFRTIGTIQDDSPASRTASS